MSGGISAGVPPGTGGQDADSEMEGHDHIGYWSELKLEILNKYAVAYSRILAADRNLSHVYIDAFAGSGRHVSRRTREVVLGSPLIALTVQPPFDKFYLIDLNGDKVARLQKEAAGRPDVCIYPGDCNQILLEKVFPNVRYEQYRRGLCILDPYKLNLHWEVLEEAGKLGTLDIFFSFMVGDANRNILWRRHANAHQRERLTRCWGDDSWEDVMYRPAAQGNLFEQPKPREAGKPRACCRYEGAASKSSSVPIRGGTVTDAQQNQCGRLLPLLCQPKAGRQEDRYRHFRQLPMTTLAPLVTRSILFRPAPFLRTSGFCPPTA